MAYHRDTIFPRKFIVGLTEEQKLALDEVAHRDKRSIASVVRECVDLYLEKIGDRRRGRRFDRREKSE